MSISYRSGQHGDVINSDNVVLPQAPLQNNLLLNLCGHFTNGTSCAGDAYTSLFELNASEWDIGAGTKYAGGGESSTQTPGSIGLNRTHHLAEFTGAVGVIGTDVPAHHEGVDQNMTAGGVYSTVSYNTLANNEGVYGLVGASCSVGDFVTAALSGGNRPQILSIFNNTTTGNRHTIQAIFYDQFPLSGSPVVYTLSTSGGSGTIKGFYGLLSLANFDTLLRIASFSNEGGGAMGRPMMIAG